MAFVAPVRRSLLDEPTRSNHVDEVGQKGIVTSEEVGTLTILRGGDDIGGAGHVVNTKHNGQRAIGLLS